MEFIYDLKECHSISTPQDYSCNANYDFKKYYVFKDLETAWEQIALWYNVFMKPTMVNRNPKIYIDEDGVIVDCYDGYDYVVESFSINIIKRRII